MWSEALKHLEKPYYYVEGITNLKITGWTKCMKLKTDLDIVWFVDQKSTISYSSHCALEKTHRTRQEDVGKTQQLVCHKCNAMWFSQKDKQNAKEKCASNALFPKYFTQCFCFYYSERVNVMCTYEQIWDGIVEWMNHFCFGEIKVSTPDTLF